MHQEKSSLILTINMWMALLALLVLVPAYAQYGRRAGPETEPNADFATFAQQRRTLLNFDWKFAFGPCEGAADPGFDDSAWRVLDLPHDFRFELPWDGTLRSSANDFKPACEGWYRKTFEADPLWKGKKVCLDFDGIMYVSDVYINGHKAGSGEYGYCGYEVDLTRYLRYDAPNVVAVYAATGQAVKSSRWYTGAGLFRDVYLEVKNPTHIARHGIFITTPEVSRERATVAVQVELGGHFGHDISLQVTLKDPDGKTVGESRIHNDKLSKARNIEVPLPEITLARPQLWSPDTPALYEAKVEVWADGVLSDCLTETFGIRKVEFTKERGFLLNGEKIFLKGVANHHDMGALGAAAFDTGIERLFRTLKAFGYNSVRCSHNPYSRSFTRIADRMGILVVDELVDKWSDDIFWGGRVPFSDYWPTMITEWVKRDRNCPSVIMWSLGNELQVRENMAGYPTSDWGVTTYRIFDVMVKRYDPTRATTVAMSPGKAGGFVFWDKEADLVKAPPELSGATEVASFNYYWRFYKEFLECNPDLIIYQSEATVRELLGPYFGMDRDKMVGIAYWGAMEYWGESNGWPKKGWNHSFFSHTLEPYPQAWLIKSGFNPEEPIVRIGIVDGGAEIEEWNDNLVGKQSYTSTWNFPEGSKQKVAVFSNADEVELLLNGKSLGRKPNVSEDICQSNIVVYQDVPFAPGRIEAVAYRSGREVARHTVETAGKAVRLNVEPEVPDQWKADGMSLQYLRVTAVDRKGRVVPGFDEPLTVSVDGPATFVAMDNGDHYTDELFYNVTTKKMKGGFMQVILRSKRGEAGAVRVQFEAASLKATADLNVAQNTIH